MSRGPRYAKRIISGSAFFFRQLLCILLALVVLGMIILLPPAGNPLRSRVPHHRREDFRPREENLLQEVLPLDVNAPLCEDGVCEISDVSSGEKRVEVTMFIVFHRRLYEKLYEGLAWSLLLPLPSSINGGVGVGVGRGEDDTVGGNNNNNNNIQSTGITTKEIVNSVKIYRQSGGRRNGNRIFFLATKEPLEIQYSPKMIEGRLLREWEMPGFVSNESFLQIYSAIFSVYRSGMIGRPSISNNPNMDSTTTTTRSKSTVRTTTTTSTTSTVPDEEWIAFLEYDMRIDQQLLRRIRQRILQQQHSRSSCCIFYGSSYNTLFLLNNTLGQRLLEEYNHFFHKSYSLRDLPPVSATGAFVVPSSVFHRIVPFLESIATQLVSNRINRRSTSGNAGYTLLDLNKSGSPTTGGSAYLSSPLEVMEGALALSLGLETEYVHVEIPIRHMTERELEEFGDE